MRARWPDLGSPWRALRRLARRVGVLGLQFVADRHRDRGRYGAAAVAYRRALSLDPDRPELWVQLGNMLKDTGQFAAAEAAYRTALAHRPDDGGIHLELGRALKLDGRIAAARVAFARAMALEPAGGDAAAEMLALGGAAPASHDLIPVDQYAVFPEQATLVEPPGVEGPRIRVGRVQIGSWEQPISTGAIVEALGRAADGFAGADWVAVARGPVAIDPAADGWIDWVARHTPAIAAFADEDWAGPPRPDGCQPRSGPLLHHALDPVLLAQGFCPYGLIAVRRDVLAGWVATAPVGADGWLALVRHLAATGPVGHIPRVLVSRLGDGPAPSALAAAGSAVAARAPEISRGPPTPICVIVPTRDRRELLEPCIAAFRRTAAHAAALEIIIVDNGSRDVATRAYLAQGQASGHFRVLAMDEPFNWAHFNNVAAMAAAAPLLVFANNDLEMLSPGWDDTLRAGLAVAETGAVGAVLLYPDRTIQHAGVVLAPGGVEHEGRYHPETASGPSGRWQMRRQTCAVTGAFLACRRSAFLEVGGFDAAGLPIWFNDIDFCLALRQAGLRIVIDPGLRAIHHESKTVRRHHGGPSGDARFRAAAAMMAGRWGEALACDPTYNPLFARRGRPFDHLCEPGLDAVTRHIVLSARANPWQVDGPADPPRRALARG